MRCWLSQSTCFEQTVARLLLRLPPGLLKMAFSCEILRNWDSFGPSREKYLFLPVLQYDGKLVVSHFRMTLHEDQL